MRKKRRFSLEIELTSLVDILFLLIIFFVLTTTFNKVGIEVNLPRGYSGSVIPQKFHTFTIDKKGKLWFDDRLISQSDIKEIAANLQHQKVRLQADKTIPYGKVIELFTLLKKLGINDVWLVIEREYER